MRAQHEIEAMAEQAKLAGGWRDADYVPVGELPGENRDNPTDFDQAVSGRIYAEGVEAGLLWALNRIDKPL